MLTSIQHPNDDNVYDLNKSEIKRESPLPNPVIASKVTALEADQIIHGIDEQFITKVLSHLKGRVESKLSKPWEAQDFKIPVATERAGENLHDYLQRIKSVKA